MVQEGMSHRRHVTRLIRRTDKQEGREAPPHPCRRKSEHGIEASVLQRWSPRKKVFLRILTCTLTLDTHDALPTTSRQALSKPSSGLGADLRSFLTAPLFVQHAAKSTRIAVEHSKMVCKYSRHYLYIRSFFLLWNLSADQTCELQGSRELAHAQTSD